MPCVRLPFAHSLQYASSAPSAFSHMSAAKSFTVLAFLHLPHLLRLQSEHTAVPSGNNHWSCAKEDLVLPFLHRGQRSGIQPRPPIPAVKQVNTISRGAGYPRLSEDPVATQSSYEDVCYRDHTKPRRYTVLNIAKEVCEVWATVSFPAAAGAPPSARAVLLEFSRMSGIGGLKQAAASPVSIPCFRKR